MLVIKPHTHSSFDQATGFFNEISNFNKRKQVTIDLALQIAILGAWENARYFSGDSDTGTSRGYDLHQIERAAKADALINKGVVVQSRRRQSLSAGCILW